MKRIKLISLLLMTVLMLCGCGSKASKQKMREAQEEIIKNNVEAVQGDLPMDMDSITKWVGMTYDGKAVTYIYEILEDELTMADILSAEARYQEAIRQNVKNNQDPAFRQFLDACKALDVAVQYRYKGNISEDSLTITIDASEL